MYALEEDTMTKNMKQNPANDLNEAWGEGESMRVHHTFPP